MLLLVPRSCLTLCDPMDVAPLSMGFPRQEYWNGLPFPSPKEKLNRDILLYMGRKTRYHKDRSSSQLDLCS